MTGHPALLTGWCWGSMDMVPTSWVPRPSHTLGSQLAPGLTSHTQYFLLPQHLHFHSLELSGTSFAVLYSWC